MKLAFEFVFLSLLACHLFLISSKLHAREVILIENLSSPAEGELVRTILIKKFHLPKELITLKNDEHDCQQKSEAIVHLCLNADGNLEIKKMNQYVVKNSLGVFLNQDEGVSE